MTKYRYGDKILVEFEVVGAYKDGSFMAIQKGRHNFVSFRSTDPIETHILRPIELAAGQTWKRVGTDQRVQVMHVDPVNHDSGRRRFVVSRFMTDIPVSNFYDDFLRAHEYVSG